MPKTIITPKEVEQAIRNVPDFPKAGHSIQRHHTRAG